MLTLIIEDDSDICLLLESIFKLNNIQYYCVESIKEAEKALLHFCPTHILVDVNLPDGNGVEWANKKDLQSKIIIMTGQDEVIENLNTFEVISKPFRMHEILNALKINTFTST